MVLAAGASKEGWRFKSRRQNFWRSSTATCNCSGCATTAASWRARLQTAGRTRLWQFGRWLIISFVHAGDNLFDHFSLTGQTRVFAGLGRRSCGSVFWAGGRRGSSVLFSGVPRGNCGGFQGRARPSGWRDFPAGGGIFRGGDFAGIRGQSSGPGANPSKSRPAYVFFHYFTWKEFKAFSRKRAITVSSERPRGTDSPRLAVPFQGHGRLGFELGWPFARNARLNI